MKDRHGQSEAFARRQLKLIDCQWPFTLRMVRGVFVVKYEVRGIGCNSWRKFPSYVALGPKGCVIKGVGGRKETITAAGGRMD